MINSIKPNGYNFISAVVGDMNADRKVLIHQRLVVINNADDIKMVL